MEAGRGEFTQLKSFSCIEQETGAPVREHFDLIAGTSTGSIIAGAAAVGIPMSGVVKLFEKESPTHLSEKMAGLVPYAKQILEPVS